MTHHKDNPWALAAALLFVFLSVPSVFAGRDIKISDQPNDGIFRVELDGDNVRASYSTHVKGTKWICRQEDMRWFIAKTVMTDVSWKFESQMHAKAQLQLEGTELDLMSFSRCPFTCLWMGGSAVFGFKKLQVNVDLYFTERSRGRVHVHFVPRKLAFDGFHIKNFQVPKWLEDEIESGLTTYALHFFETNFGKKLMEGFEKSLNDYFDSHHPYDDKLENIMRQFLK